MLAIVLALGLPGATVTPARPPDQCSAYVGQKVAPVDFVDVKDSLPAIAARGAYESSQEYEQRLESSATGPMTKVIVRQALSEPLSYDPDKGEVAIYPWSLGAGKISFSNTFNAPDTKGFGDNFSSAIAFMISASETSKDTYQAQNGFGAHFTIERTLRDVRAVHDRPGKTGKSIFVGAKSTGPIARLKLSPAAAQDIIERGSLALLIVPKPPYLSTDASRMEPTIT